jgi:DNA-binding transcriptional MerR regulator
VPGARYAIGDLAALGGVSRRTVRYYVQEGLIPPPLGLGRGDHYTDAHLEQLLRVRALQEAGRTLDEILRELGRSRPGRSRGEAAPAAAPMSRAVWRRLTVAPGVEVHVASTVRLPSSAKLQELADWCRRHFAGTDATERDEEPHA